MQKFTHFAVSLMIGVAGAQSDFFNDFNTHYQVGENDIWGHQVWEPEGWDSSAWDGTDHFFNDFAHINNYRSIDDVPSRVIDKVIEDFIKEISGLERIFYTRDMTPQQLHQQVLRLYNGDGGFGPLTRSIYPADLSIKNMGPDYLGPD